MVGRDAALGVDGRPIDFGLRGGLTTLRSVRDRGMSCNERMDGDLGDCMDEAETKVSSDDADLAVVGRGPELVVDSCLGLVGTAPLITRGVTRGLDDLTSGAALAGGFALISAGLS